MTDAGVHNPDRDLRAAELALGLLSGAERAEAERDLLRDPAFRASHAFWTATANQWLEDVPPEQAGSDLWPAIEAAIADERRPNPRTIDTQSDSGRPSFVWAIAATLAAVLAGTAATYFYQREAAARRDNASLLQQLAEAGGERHVAQITGASSRVLVTALYNPASGTVDLKLDLPSKPSLVPELWVIPNDGKPRSLGTFTTASAQLEVRPELRPFIKDGATLAVTMEPSAGAPHASPTGPVLGATQLQAI